MQVQITDKSTCQTEGLFHGISLIVDGTDCPIDTPSTSKEEKLNFCCGRNKDNAHSKYNWKYTLAVCISTGKICQILGPVIGRISDVEALRQEEHKLLLDGDFLLADKGYQGHEKCLTPVKKTKLTTPTFEDEAFNEILSSVRQLVECTIGRVKQFGVLGSAGRFHCDKTKHVVVFNVCCQITNIKIERNPIWSNKNWFL